MSDKPKSLITDYSYIRTKLKKSQKLAEDRHSPRLPQHGPPAEQHVAEPPPPRIPRPPTRLVQTLTPRQLEVAALLVSGYKLSEAAKRLGLSPGTIKVYISQLYDRLGFAHGRGQSHYDKRMRLYAMWMDQEDDEIPCPS